MVLEITVNKDEALPTLQLFLICVFDQINEVFADVLDSSRALLVLPSLFCILLVPISAIFYERQIIDLRRPRVREF
jgi:hypothetical protein